MAPPNANQIEKAILSCCLQGTESARDAISQCLGTIQMGDFYAPRHGYVFQCIVKLFEEGKPVDANTVLQQAKDLNLTKEIGDARYLGELLDEAPLYASLGE